MRHLMVVALALATLVESQLPARAAAAPTMPYSLKEPFQYSALLSHLLFLLDRSTVGRIRIGGRNHHGSAAELLLPLSHVAAVAVVIRIRQSVVVVVVCCGSSTIFMRLLLRGILLVLSIVCGRKYNPVLVLQNKVVQFFNRGMMGVWSNLACQN